MRNRENGFLRIMQEKGIPRARCHMESVPVSSSQAREKVKEIYRTFPFDGIFCGTDTIAIGAMRGIEDIGMAIPSDIQVIGFDGIALGEFTSPPLSTIRQDTDAMGKIAAESICQDDKRGPQR